MTYRPLFKPRADRIAGGATQQGAGDRRDGRVYVYTPEIELAVNVALAARRPLLISGPPGSGKSSLAANVARWQRWRYYEEVVTARTQARDLLWGFDAVRRLSDAQATRRVREAAAYIEPGVLWWAMDPASARRRGAADEPAPAAAAADAPAPAVVAAAGVEGGEPDVPPPVEPVQEQRVARAPGSVVLIDEIDKADPDVPNSLLVALGSLRFTVEETGFEVHAADTSVPFVVVTTNDERELPKAFVRRCATLTLRAPDKTRLLAIARAQFPKGSTTLHEAVADLVTSLTATDPAAAPSTAEFIDAIRACGELHVEPSSTEWETIRRILLAKRVSADAPPAP